MQNKKETIIFSVISVLTIIMTVVGLSFAYFSATLTGDPASVNVTTASLGSVTFEGGNDFETGTDIMPGWSEEKTVTFEMTGSDVDQSTVINLEYTNNFTDLKYKIELAKIEVDGVEVQSSNLFTNTLTSSLTTLPAADETSYITLATINTIASSSTIKLTYTVTMALESTAGNTNMGKEFEGTLYAAVNPNRYYYNNNNPTGGSSIGSY